MYYIMIFNTHNSYIYYNDTSGMINDYNQYIVELIKSILADNKESSINILFSNNDHNINTNTNINIKIDVNYEHTLVKNGGRTSNGSPFGVIPCENNEFYLVRIQDYNRLNNSDIIIDYSIPNIHNVNISNLFNDFAKKHIYISPSFYNINFNREKRDIICLTTFINTNEPRRGCLLESIRQRNIQHINVNNCFEKNALEKIYNNTKILINIHQTDHHHTFEELRVLPAIRSGVIVICEKTPLTELIPYNEYIIWSDYHTILDKVEEVIDRYDYYYDLIYKNRDHSKLKEMHIDNYKTLANKLFPN